MPKVKLGKRLICLKCDYEWLPRQEVVFRCPKCQSFTWDTAKEGEDEGSQEANRD